MADKFWTDVPAAAFGPGARLDVKNNTLYGADGHIYTDLRISRAQFDQLCEELGIPRPPKDWKAPQ